jgi:molecular chaperone Hsp33
MIMPDFSQRFHWETLPVRGALCRLDETYGRVLRDFQGSPAVARLLGEILAGTALLATTQGSYERLIVQAQSQGALRLLVAEISQAGGLRAYARWQEGEPVDLATLPGALLAITVDPGLDRERYQGLVTLRDTVAESLNAYFAESEQSPAFFRLMADPQSHQAAGYFVQRLPGVMDPADWQLLTRFLAVGPDAALFNMAPEDLLPQAFPGEGVRLFPPQALRFSCSCSRQRVADMLRALGQEEVEETLEEQGVISVTCEYCRESYRFEASDVAMLFKEETDGAPLH